MYVTRNMILVITLKMRPVVQNKKICCESLVLFAIQCGKQVIDMLRLYTDQALVYVNV